MVKKTTAITLENEELKKLDKFILDVYGDSVRRRSKEINNLIEMFNDLTCPLCQVGKWVKQKQIMKDTLDVFCSTCGRHIVKINEVKNSEGKPVAQVPLNETVTEPKDEEDDNVPPLVDPEQQNNSFRA